MKAGPELDRLDVLAQSALARVRSGYYRVERSSQLEPTRSLKAALKAYGGNPVIAEVKFSSPSVGSIRTKGDPVLLAKAMLRGGATGLSILTDPDHFEGSLMILNRIRAEVSAPLLMKDFVIDTEQVNAARINGADAILLIQTLFDRGYCTLAVEKMIDYAHEQKLEVLLESYTDGEFERASRTAADVLGINNRDLRTMDVNLHQTERIMEQFSGNHGTVVSESGLESPNDLRRLKRCGVTGFLIGTAIMSSNDVEKKVRHFVEA